LVLNSLWVGFFLAAFISGLIQHFWLNDAEIFNRLLQAVFDGAKAAFDIALGLVGALTFWLGILRVGERSGFVRLLTRGLAPLFRRLMPRIPADHPALGAMVMNLSANLLGLDNAATPLGIKAMQELQSLNPDRETASDPQILFYVINASSVTLFPVSIFAYRAQMGAAHPADVFFPILLATSCSTVAGFVSVALRQRINLLDPVILGYGIGFALLLAGLLAYFIGSGHAELQQRSATLSSFFLSGLIALFLAAASYRKINRVAPNAKPLILQYFEVPKSGGKPEKVFDEGVRVVSNPMSQAVESLHPSDRMLHGNSGFSMMAIMFNLCVG
jgi:spore maturation protein SpmA